MKDLFPGYYHKPDLKKLFQNCLFVFDTSSLLALYKLPKNYTLEVFKVFNDDQIVERLWIPYQVALEFQKNRFNKYKEQENENDVRAYIGNVNKSIETLKEAIKNRSLLQDQLLDAEDALEKLENAKSDVKKIKKDYKPNYLYKDSIRDRIDELFEGKIGRKYDEEELKEIYKEGEKRYRNKIPPGYEDNKKKTDNKYGDLVIWKQIMEYAKSNNLCVILIINDSKKDWWFETEGPQAELIEEFLEETGQEFHIINLSSFLNEVNDKLELGKDKNTLKLIEDLIEINESINKFQNVILQSNSELFNTINGSILGDPETIEKINRAITIDPEILEKINRAITIDSEFQENLKRTHAFDTHLIRGINYKAIADNKEFWNKVKKDLEKQKKDNYKNNQDESDEEENQGK